MKPHLHNVHGERFVPGSSVPRLLSGVDRPPTLTRRLANRPFSVLERASRPSFLRVQARRVRSQVVFAKGRFAKGRSVHRRSSSSSPILVRGGGRPTRSPAPTRPPSPAVPSGRGWLEGSGGSGGATVSRARSPAPGPPTPDDGRRRASPGLASIVSPVQGSRILGVHGSCILSPRGFASLRHCMHPC